MPECVNCTPWSKSSFADCVHILLRVLNPAGAGQTKSTSQTNKQKNTPNQSIKPTQTKQVRHEDREGCCDSVTKSTGLLFAKDLGLIPNTYTVAVPLCISNSWGSMNLSSSWPLWACTNAVHRHTLRRCFPLCTGDADSQYRLVRFLLETAQGKASWGVKVYLSYNFPIVVLSSEEIQN